MEGTSSNNKCFNANAIYSSRYKEVNSNVRSPSVKSDPDSLYYDMSGDKFLIIFNHYEFKRTMRFRCRRPSTREGTFKDVDRLKTVFGNLGFKVIVYQDLKYKDILKQVSSFCNRDHSNTSCVCVAILTYRDAGGKLFAGDRPYLLSDVHTFFENGHDGLLTKPKVFIVQACQSANMDARRSAQLDGEGSSELHVPSPIDFFVLRSSVDDYPSYRDLNGSWVIQALCKVMERHSEELDILQMVTKINKIIAYKKATYTPSNAKTNNKKQMTGTRFTLTKLLKFR